MADSEEKTTTTPRSSLRLPHRHRRGRLLESASPLISRAPAQTMKLGTVSFDGAPVEGILELGDAPLSGFPATTGELASESVLAERPSGIYLIVADAVALAGAAAAALALQPVAGHGHGIADLCFVAGFVVLATVLFAARGSYRVTSKTLANTWNDLRVVVPGIAVLGWLLFAGLRGAYSGARSPVSDVDLGLVVLLGSVAVPLARMTCRSLQRRTRRQLRIVVLGSGMMARRVARSLAWDPCIKVLGLVDDDPANSDSVLGGTADLGSLCEQLKVDQVVVAFSRTHPAEVLERLRALHLSVDVAVVPRYFELLSSRSGIHELAGIPLMSLAPPQLGLSARVAKRLFDIVVSAVALVVLSPVLCVLALLIKLTSDGPVLFRQERIGYRYQPFVIFKFRTMRRGHSDVPAALRALSEVDGPLFKMRNDPRITPVGRFLRRTSLDELPQLVNVLKGDMSLVGPRPFVSAESAQMVGHALRRFDVRPGLTGLWQISGRSMLSYDEVTRLDYLYVASWTFWWDVKILLSTPAKVLRGFGAF